ncbi:MAG TPA: helix-turn-helix transcriptional regulator [Polyangiaceae bacterium]|jgi:transcriptional regulator with XRE-family HTH domain
MTIKRARSARRSAAAGYLEKLLRGPLTLGGALSAIRESDGESLALFAERLGISRSHLSDIEHGRRSVSLQKASEFALALGHHQAQFVRLALQDQVRGAGLKLRVDVRAA